MLSRRVLALYQPLVIGITGSVGKTSTKEAIAVVLERRFHVRKSPMTLNDAIGVPLSVLGIAPAGTHLAKATWQSRWGVVLGLWRAIWLAWGPRQIYPKILVLEMGADKPGEIAYLTDLVRPKIAIVTALGDIPVHIEHYPDVSAVAFEKSRILKYAAPPIGISILNADDARVSVMRELTPGQVMMFGYSEGAEVRASGVAFFQGLSFTVHYKKQSVRFRIPGIIAVHQISSILAAVCVGLHLGMSLVEFAHAFEEYRAPEKRMTVISGANDTWIIDDTYNASPLSMEAALHALKQYPGKRKIAILGDMKELGKYAAEAHKKIMLLADASADVVITVGELWGSGRTADSSEAVRPLISKLIQPGDIILVKGSRAMQMEKVVDAIKA